MQYENYEVQKIWTIKGLKSGRTLDGWYRCIEGECGIIASELEYYEEEWGEKTVIQLGYGVIADNISNVGSHWFFETKEEAQKDLDKLLDDLSYNVVASNRIDKCK